MYEVNLQYYFDLKQTLTCGQMFRYKRLDENDFLVAAGDMVARLIFSPSNHTLSMDTGDPDFWLDYLQVNHIYRDAISVCNNHDILRCVYQHSGRLRIVKQDSWETLVSFIISQNNSITRISGTIESMCNSISSSYRAEWNNISSVENIFATFPTPNDIITAYEMGRLQWFGYRDKYLYEASKAVISGELNLNNLTPDVCSLDKCIGTLTRFDGIGPKVANCIALFGLGHLNAFPIDRWIQRFLDRYFDGSIPEDIETCKESGVIQQWIFNYFRSIGGL